MASESVHAHTCTHVRTHRNTSAGVCCLATPLQDSGIQMQDDGDITVPLISLGLSELNV